MKAAVPALLAAAAVTGCADPYATEHKPAVAGEQPAKRIERPRDRGEAARTPEAAARRAAELAGNWNGETVRDRYTTLAKATVDNARRQAEQVAAQAGTDPQLSAPGARSVAIVHAVAIRGTGPRRRAIVVTHETLTADGLTEARWRVTVAVVRRQGDGWVVAKWEPQP